ncbi:hypothetical protein LTR53_009175, partial [Teratosphaeriaceae sp. CCFEE 6253]
RAAKLDGHLNAFRGRRQQPYGAKQSVMQEAIHALHDLTTPCPFGAFGTVIVNHTGPHDELVCIGANSISSTGNPTLHGEIAGINNCTAVLTDPQGAYRLSPAQAQAAFRNLTLYTTAEPCPMCSSAIRWAGFRECVFGTSIATLVELGWSQIDLTAQQVFALSTGLPSTTKLLGNVLTNATDALFAWQYDEAVQCPKGCARNTTTESCSPAASPIGRRTQKEL